MWSSSSFRRCWRFFSAFMATAGSRSCLPQVSCVTERIPPGLRPDREAVRLGADLDLLHRAARRVDRVDHVVESTREPERLPVGADVAHVGAAAARDRPVRNHPPRGELINEEPPWAVRAAVDLA